MVKQFGKGVAEALAACAGVLVCMLGFACLAPLALAVGVQTAAADPAAAVESISLVGQFLQSVPQWLQAVSLVVTAASSIAALTPSPKDDGVLKKVRAFVDFFALNFGGAGRSKS